MASDDEKNTLVEMVKAWRECIPGAPGPMVIAEAGDRRIAAEKARADEAEERELTLRYILADGVVLVSEIAEDNGLPPLDYEEATMWEAAANAVLQATAAPDGKATP